MYKKIAILGIVIVTITGCSRAKEKVESQSNIDAALANSLGNTYYPVIMRNVNKDRNEYYASLADTNDYLWIGRELEKLSSSHFATDSHYLAEGQYISQSDREELLKRTNLEVKNKTYPNSLQPDRGTSVGDVANPVMVNALYEQDFYTDKKGKQLAGVSVAIVLDPKGDQGAQLEKPMKDEDISNYGKQIIPKLYNYLNKKKELNKIPIQICVYQAANQIDSYTNGHYILQSFHDGHLGEISTLQTLSGFITSDPITSIDKKTPSEFEALKLHLKGLSTDAIGVTGIANYKDKEIQNLTITVVINVKTYGEQEFFVSGASEALDSAFSEMFDVKMIVKATNDVVAVIRKNKGHSIEVNTLY